MIAALRKIFNIKSGEAPKVLYISLYLFSATGALILLRSLINALLLQVCEVSALPYVFTAQAIFFVIVSVGYTAFISKASKRVEVNVFLTLFLLILIASRFFLAFHYKWFVFVLYVIIETFSVILLIQCWMLISDCFDSRQGKRLYPIVGVGSTIGAISGGFFAKGFAKTIGTENLIFCTLPLIGMTLFLGQKIISNYYEQAPSSSHENQGENLITRLGNGFVEIFKDNLLLILMIFVVCARIGSTLIDFQFKASVKAAYSMDEITAFMGAFYAFSNFITFFIQLFVANRFLMIFGFAMGLAVMPIAVFFGTTVFLLIPIFWFIVGTKFFEDVARYSIGKSSVELAYLPLPQQVKQRAKVTFDGMIVPVSVIIASCVLIFTKNFLSVRTLSFLVIAFAGIAIAVCFRMKKPYTEKLKEALSSRKIRLQEIPGLGDLIGRQSKDMINNSLKGSDESAILFSLQLSQDFKIPVDISKIESLYQNKNKKIKVAALETVRVIGNKGYTKKIISLLEKEDDPEVKSECLRTLKYISDEDLNHYVIPYLKDYDSTVRANCIIYLFAKGGIEGIISSAESLKSLINSNKKENLQAAAYIMGELKENYFNRALKNLLLSKDYNVRLAAITAAGSVASDDLLPQLLEYLKDKRFSRFARKSISNYKPSVVPKLLEEYGSVEGNMFYKIQLLKILANFSCDESASALIEILSSEFAEIRYTAEKSLIKLKKETVDLSRYNERIISTLEDEMNVGYKFYVLLDLLPKESGAGLEIINREIEHRIKQANDRIFRLLALIYNQNTIYKIYLNFMSKQKRLISNSMELLDNLLDRSISKEILPFLEDMTLEEKVRLAKEKGKVEFKENLDWIDVIVGEKDDWLTNVAFYCNKTEAKKRFPEEFERRKYMIPVLEKIYFLKGVPLFSELSGETLRLVSDMVKEVSFEKGATIFKENDPGDSLYLILSGKVKVEKSGKEVTVLKERSCFGEIALLDYAPRTATIKTIEDCDLLRLNKEDFWELLEEYPEISKGVMQILAKRLRSSLEKFEVSKIGNPEAVSNWG